ncbi:hypothetical protein ACOSP7_027007 [Xanthoceras sorbifolium]
MVDLSGEQSLGKKRALTSLNSVEFVIGSVVSKVGSMVKEEFVVNLKEHVVTVSSGEQSVVQGSNFIED